MSELEVLLLAYLTQLSNALRCLWAGADELTQGHERVAGLFARVDWLAHALEHDHEAKLAIIARGATQAARHALFGLTDLEDQAMSTPELLLVLDNQRRRVDQYLQRAEVLLASKRKGDLA